LADKKGRFLASWLVTGLNGRIERVKPKGRFLAVLVDTFQLEAEVPAFGRLSSEGRFFS
jgi:hypothetical protein